MKEACMTYKRLFLGAGVAVCMAACGGGSNEPAASTDPWPTSLGSSWVQQISGSNWESGEVTSTVIANATVDSVDDSVVIETAGAITTRDIIQRTASALVSVPSDTSDALSTALGPKVILRLPLVVGDTWTQMDQTIAMDVDADGMADEVSVLTTVRVDRQEDVQTPAGNFHDAFVVITGETVTVAGYLDPMVQNTTDWYVLGVGRVKREVFTVPIGAVHTIQHSEVLSRYSIR
jgi:hypothetical protein